MSANKETGFKTADVSFDEFRRGLPAGVYRVVVNPERAQKYVQYRLWIKILMLPVIGIGVALSFSGYSWAGLPLVAFGIFFPRMIKKKAPEILLHLALRDQKIYREAIEYEILEVRAQSQ